MKQIAVICVHSYLATGLNLFLQLGSFCSWSLDLYSITDCHQNCSRGVLACQDFDVQYFVLVSFKDVFFDFMAANVCKFFFNK